MRRVTDQRADRVNALSDSQIHGLLRGDAVSDNNRYMPISTYHQIPDRLRRPVIRSIVFSTGRAVVVWHRKGISPRLVGKIKRKNRSARKRHGSVEFKECSVLKVSVEKKKQGKMSVGGEREERGP
jgi:hypothetical protein